MATIKFIATYPATPEEIEAFSQATGYQPTTVIDGKTVPNPVTAEQFICNNVSDLIATYLHQFTRAEIHREKELEAQATVAESYQGLKDGLSTTIE